MKILKAGTKVVTVVGQIEALVTGVCITEQTIEYKIRWFYNGEERIAWVYRYEIEVAKPKQSAGFNSKKQIEITDSEFTLIAQ